MVTDWQIADYKLMVADRQVTDYDGSRFADSGRKKIAVG